MDKYIFDKNNGLWYELIGDYYFPCLTAPTEKEQPVACGVSGTSGISKNTAQFCITPCC